ERVAVCGMRETVLAYRVVDPPRQDVRRARHQRPEVGAVDAAPLVHVHDVDASGRGRDTERIARYEPDLDAGVAEAVRERSATARDETLADAAPGEPADQQLRL